MFIYFCIILFQILFYYNDPPLYINCILNLFQYEVRSWSGRSLDVYGNCDVKQILDGTSMLIEKKQCQKSKAEERHNFSENVLENSSVSYAKKTKYCK